MGIDSQICNRMRDAFIKGQFIPDFQRRRKRFETGACEVKIGVYYRSDGLSTTGITNRVARVGRCNKACDGIGAAKI